MVRVRISRRAVLTAAGAGAVGGGAWLGAEAFRRSQIEAAALPLLQAGAHAFDIAKPDSVWSPALSKALDGARIIGLGEATHGSHEDAAVKAAIIKGLIASGAIRALLLEVNAPGGRELDAFVRSGTGSAYDRLRTAKVFRVVKTQALGDLLGWIRDWNSKAVDPVRIFGIDCQASAQDAMTAFEALKAVSPEAAEQLAPSLQHLLSEEAQALRFPALIKSLTTAQLLEALKALQTLQDTLSRTGAGRDAVYAARTAWQGLKAFEMETSDGKITGDADAYYSRRDVFMAENVLSAPADGAAALWAHNMHVIAGQPAGTTYEPTGAVLRKRLGDAYRAVVVEYGTAEFNAVPRSPIGAYPNASDPTEVVRWTDKHRRTAAILSKAESGAFWVSLRDLPDNEAVRAWLKLPYKLDWPGYSATHWQAFSLEPSIPTGSLFDVVVYVEALTPSRAV